MELIYNTTLYRLSSILLIIFISSCNPIYSNFQNIGQNYASYYLTIDDKNVYLFIQSSLKWLKNTYGDTLYKIEKINIRRSQKKWGTKKYNLRENFQLTECADKYAGEYTIYLSVGPSHPEFYPLLGHEIGHLLDIDFVGPEAEGFCTVISRQLCERTRHDWTAWERRFAKEDTLYARSYRAMQQLHDIAPPQFSTIRQHIVTSEDKHRFDFRSWANDLSPQQQTRVLVVQSTYPDILQANTTGS